MKRRYQFRQATEDDSQILCAAERAIAMTPGFLISLPSELTEESFSNKIKFLTTHGYYLVAEDEGKIAGHAVLEPIGTISALSHVFTLSSLVCHVGFRGQGIGTSLMEMILGWALTQEKIAKIELRVREGNNRAIRLYSRFGFVVEGRFEKRIKLPNGEYIADISMAWFPDRERHLNSPLDTVASRLSA